MSKLNPAKVRRLMALTKAGLTPLQQQHLEREQLENLQAVGAFPRSLLSSRVRKPWQKVSDATPRGTLGVPGKVEPHGVVCKEHRIAAKRVRVKIDGVKRKVWQCPRCEERNDAR
jgi:hypothetical protein